MPLAISAPHTGCLHLLTNQIGPSVVEQSNWLDTTAPLYTPISDMILEQFTVYGTF